MLMLPKIIRRPMEWLGLIIAFALLSAVTATSAHASDIDKLVSQQMSAPISASVTSAFGMRKHPISRERRMHTGIDLKSRCNKPIRSSAAGRVKWAASRGGYGNQVAIDHGRIGGKEVATSYSHQSRMAVHRGQYVKRDQIIGYVGSTGASTGCHLHFEMTFNGKTVNPAGRYGAVSKAPSHRTVKLRFQMVAKATPRKVMSRSAVDITATGRPQTLKGASAGRYAVKFGDTLNGIATKHGLRNWKPIVAANPGSIRNPDIIYPGQSFLIPVSGNSTVARKLAVQAKPAGLRPHRRSAEKVLNLRPVSRNSDVSDSRRSGLRPSMALAWKVIRECESGSNYRNWDTGRNGHYGAYQFGIATWRSVGGRGNPAAASRAEQDRRAQMLYDQRGFQPWACARKLVSGNR